MSNWTLTPFATTCGMRCEEAHVSVFGALMHRRRAQRAGFDDALFTSHEGLKCEISASNIGFVRGVE